MNDKNTQIADKIKEIRIHNNQSQSEIAKAINLTVTAYSRIENNKTQLTINNLFKIAEALDTPVAILLELSAASYVQNTNNVVMTNFNHGTLNLAIDIAQLKDMLHTNR